MFNIVLLSFGNLVKGIVSIASKRDNSFKNRLNSRNMTIVIKTKGNREAVQYMLEDGNIYLKRGIEQLVPDPDISVTFLNTRSAYLMVLKPTPRLLIDSFMNALGNGELKLEFKAESLMWLVETMQKLPRSLNFNFIKTCRKKFL